MRPILAGISYRPGHPGQPHFTKQYGRQQSLLQLESEAMDTRERTAQLESWALEAGFDKAAAAELVPSQRVEFFKSWLDREHHADMQYLERRTELRFDPREILPGARSVLCVALRYHPLGEERDCGGDLWPGVARYARGDDYHLFMKKRVAQLAERIETAFPTTKTRYYVDTGPILERELAARAGLGSVGKNTMLLDPEMGSWFLLGEILLTMDLEPDVAGSDLCGTCTACLEACPTGALPAPYRLDSRLCISYWTIEHRGDIPPDVRPLLGSWVFGCDVCQEVCPVNTGLSSEDHPEFAVPAHRKSLELTDLMTMSRETYTESFRKSPMKRAKLEGLQRNAAIAMGNSKSTRYTEALLEALSSHEVTVRRHAAWALGQISTRVALEGLLAALASEPDEDVRNEISAALGDSG